MDNSKQATLELGTKPVGTLLMHNHQARPHGGEHILPLQLDVAGAHLQRVILREEAAGEEVGRYILRRRHKVAPGLTLRSIRKNRSAL